jgi:hypothetical protein
MALLRTIWDRVRNQPKESVDLHPVEQIALRYLLQFGPHSTEDIRQEVSGSRTLLEDEFEDSLAHLTDSGLVEANPGIGPNAPAITYSATTKSNILKNRIPQDPRGVTEFYL